MGTMPRMDDTTPADRPRTTGWLLLLAALCLAIMAYSFWDKATDDAESAARTAEITRAIHLENGQAGLAAAVDTDPEPDRTLPIATGAAAAVAAVCGTIAVTSARSPASA